MSNSIFTEDESLSRGLNGSDRRIFASQGPEVEVLGLMTFVVGDTM